MWETQLQTLSRYPGAIAVPTRILQKASAVIGPRRPIVTAPRPRKRSRRCSRRRRRWRLLPRPFHPRGMVAVSCSQWVCFLDDEARSEDRYLLWVYGMDNSERLGSERRERIAVSGEGKGRRFPDLTGDKNIESLKKRNEMLLFLTYIFYYKTPTS